jgi:hypothetical protein
MPDMDVIAGAWAQLELWNAIGYPQNFSLHDTVNKELLTLLIQSHLPYFAQGGALHLFQTSTDSLAGTGIVILQSVA